MCAGSVGQLSSNCSQIHGVKQCGGRLQSDGSNCKNVSMELLFIALKIKT